MTRSVLLFPVLFFALPSTAQQVIFSEDFEGAQPAFTLNTPDMTSTETGDNSWLVNDAYTGGEGTLNCLGIPFTFTIPNTAAQPAEISSPNGKYLHITSAAAISSGIANCNFAAADGICTNAATHFTRMAADVSTLGATDVTLSFWWLCAGGPNSYGELYYTTDGGTSWMLISTPIASYSNQSTWTQQSITLPVFAGHASLRFGFRFVNNQATAASDPAFGIDDVSITSTAATEAIATGTLTDSSYCPGSSLSVPYTATGTWNTGNIFTAQLSDINGSFGAPTDIGSLTAVTSGIISAAIPSSTPAGSGYLVRVVGSSPAIIAGNTVAIALVDAPYAGEGHHISFCDNDDPQNLLDQLPGASPCGTWTGPDGSPMSGILDPSIGAEGGYTYTANCPGNCPADQAVLTVGIVPAPNAGDSTSLVVCTNDPMLNLFTALAGAPDAGGYWTHNAMPQSGIFNPSVDPSGCYWYTVAGTSPCMNATAPVCITLEDCSGIAEDGHAWAGLRWSGQQGDLEFVELGDARPEQLRLIDPSGRSTASTNRIIGSTLVLDMKDAASGVYMLRLINGSRVGAVRLVYQR